MPIDPALIRLAAGAALVVTVEDGVVAGGIGSRISQTLRDAGNDVPTREIGVPVRFLEHGSVADVRASAGLTVQDIGRRIVEWAAMWRPAATPARRMTSTPLAVPGRSRRTDGSGRCGSSS